MELLILISGIGTVVLLAVHMFDYFVESMRQPSVHARLPGPHEAVPAEVAHQPSEAAAQYDEAA